MLDSALARKSNVIRKGIAYALQAPRTIRRLGVRKDDFLNHPPILVNSVPKSGTHLLMQIARALPDTVYYGSFLAQSPSLTLRRRTQAEVNFHISRIIPGEVVGAHLHYSSETEHALNEINALHLFIYRDPRDIALSSSTYLSGMNKWNAVHRMMKDVDSAERLRIVVEGLDDSRFPSLRERILPYAGWRHSPSTVAVSYEDLAGEDRESVLRRIAQSYVARRPGLSINENLIEALNNAIKPEMSHTFRSGRTGGWKTEMGTAAQDHFYASTGDLVQDFGYSR
jgi:sulfotransferase 6B1